MAMGYGYQFLEEEFRGFFSVGIQYQSESGANDHRLFHHFHNGISARPMIVLYASSGISQILSEIFQHASMDIAVLPRKHSIQSSPERSRSQYVVRRFSLRARGN